MVGIGRIGKTQLYRTRLDHFPTVLLAPIGARNVRFAAYCVVAEREGIVGSTVFDALLRLAPSAPDIFQARA
jgi:hypothetical protein